MSEQFLKIWEGYHYLLLRYGLKHHAGSALSLYDVIKVMQVCFNVNVISFLSTCTCVWCMLGTITWTKCVFAHPECVCDRTHIIICMIQHSYTSYRSLGLYIICFQGFGVTMD